MTITRTQLAQDFSTSNAQSYTTASQTPVANCLCTAVVKIFGSAPVGRTIDIAGNSIKWSLFGEYVDSESIATPTSRLAIFQGISASPTAGTAVITIVGSGNLDCHWDFQQWNAFGVARLVQFGRNQSNGATSITVTLPQALNNTANAVYMGYAISHGTETITAGGSYTKLADLQDATDGESLGTCWLQPGTTTPSMSDDGSSSARAGLAVEIEDVLTPTQRSRIYSFPDKSRGISSWVNASTWWKAAHV